MKKQNVRTLSLIVCTFTYLLIGAAVFDSLESKTERNRFEVLQGKIMEYIDAYESPPSGSRRRSRSSSRRGAGVGGAGRARSRRGAGGGGAGRARCRSQHSWARISRCFSHSNCQGAIEGMIIRKYNITPEDFLVMETVVLKSEPHKAGQQWKFTGAFYYATTVLTTIGYGHSTPATVGGKLFTMFYAIVGIPLGLIMFQSIGERVNRLSSVIIRSIKRAMKCQHTNASEVDLICVVTTLSSLTIAGGAAAFSRFEGWSYFDSVYYCFITLTTIGFGDMVALQKDNALNRKPSYVMFALIFILFGLAIVAACLNLLVLRFVTMNTEDEKRDQRQAEQAQQVAVRLEGDVITADGAVLRGVARGTRLPAGGQQGVGPAMRAGTGDTSLVPLYVDEDTPSVCSCSCNCFNCFGHNRSIPYRDPLSPLQPSHVKPIKSRDLANMRYIDTTNTRSTSLRLNSASGYLHMNARNDFHIDTNDFREMVAKRRHQLRRGMMVYDDMRYNNNEQYMKRYRESISPHSSLYSMNMREENRSNDPLVEDRDSERSSYARNKLIKNIHRNIGKPQNMDKRENYFYDDAILHFDDEYAFDGSILFAKRRKSNRHKDYTCKMPHNYDQVSNDGSYGYYLPDDEQDCYVNDTLTFNLPPHRASI